MFKPETKDLVLNHPEDYYIDLQQITFLVSSILSRTGITPNRRIAVALRALVYACEHGTYHEDDLEAGQAGYLELPHDMSMGELFDFAENEQKLELDTNVTA